MGNTRTKPWGYRHGTRNKFAKKYRTHGMPAFAKYNAVFKKGDYVDIVVDPSIQKGMPYGFYHGRTGVIFNVNKNAVGVEVNKVVGNHQLKKRIHVRVEHVRKSRCNEDFLKRIKENDEKKREAKAKGERISTKRVPEGPKPEKIVEVNEDEMVVLAPLPFIENYF
uniref:Ribosomal protein L21 n=1 Tax=Amphidinium carterae TaxID=2961 RepID=F8QQK8_AMPCA|nr:ribosomal protein L21 [Amphidinium carterae]|mmetsp:Transcript_21127/g.48499  ORF Transcript_21127/g.48499 Transcript_21127/m.48499 type:complete len:166 (-) Transcript_21127:102-599(-)